MYKTLRDRVRPESLTDKNIILDIDETLIYSQEEIEDFKKLGVFSNPELLNLRERIYILKFPDGNMWGMKRPYVEDFLIFCFSYFKRVIIWSAGTEDYVQKLVKHLFKDLFMPDLIYSKEDCVFVKNRPTYKPLKLMMEKEKWLGLTEQNTLFIDDYHKTFKNNPENAVHIPKFNFVPEDLKDFLDFESMSKEESLRELMKWLMRPEVIKSKDVRILDKSNIFSRESSF